jgi:hypothetical protein
MKKLMTIFTHINNHDVTFAKTTIGVSDIDMEGVKGYITLGSQEIEIEVPDRDIEELAAEYQAEELRKEQAQLSEKLASVTEKLEAIEQ